MANQFNIARPYAKAAFQSAVASADLALWSKVLHVFSNVIDDKTVHSFLNNPVITKDQWCDFFIGFLNTICKDSYSETQNQIESFIRLLVEYNHFNVFPEIFVLFERYLAKSEGYAQLIVHTPFLMDEKERDQFKKSAIEKLKTNVTVDFHIDPNLIGGLIVRSGNWVLDDSFQNKLKKLKSALS